MTLLLPNIQNPIYSYSFKGERAITKGSIFLTITCVETPSFETIEAGGSRLTHQFSRCDIPLKFVNKSKLKPQNMAKMGWTDPDNSALLDKLNQHYHVEKYCAPKPYVLIPYSKSNVEVRMTLSEVQDWPKAFVIGQITQPLR